MPAAPTRPARQGLAITSLVLGIVAVVGVILGVLFNQLLFLLVGLVAGIVGLVLGLVARPRRSGMALAGTILSAVGLGSGILVFVAGLLRVLGVM